MTDRGQILHELGIFNPRHFAPSVTEEHLKQPVIRKRPLGRCSQVLLSDPGLETKWKPKSVALPPAHPHRNPLQTEDSTRATSDGGHSDRSSLSSMHLDGQNPVKRGPPAHRIGVPKSINSGGELPLVANPKGIRDDAVQVTGAPQMAEGGSDEMVSGSTPPVFISYASQDAAVAAALVEALERRGIACWIAPRDVEAGALYADAIIRAISGAKALVLVLSRSAIASSHVGKEVERASSKRRPIFALRIDTAPLTPALEYFLSESQWVEAKAGNMEPAHAKLIGAIRRSEPTAQGSIPAVAPSSGTTGAPPKSRRNRILLAAGLAVIAALVAILADKVWFAKHAATERPPTVAANVAGDKSIAVLPFTDMSEKGDQAYFADGMAEEVLDLLTKIPGIRVIGRTSSFQFKDKSGDLRTIGNTLGAAYVVEGSVRQSGNRLRVTAQLIGTKDGSHIWSETYDEKTGDVLGIQDRIAAGIVRALQVAVGADGLEGQPRLKNAQAYDLYLRGRHEMDRFDRSGFETAAGYFQQALEIDPSLVRAAEWLAAAQEFMAEWGFVPVRRGYEVTRASLDRALKLDPRSGLAHALMCTVNAIYDWDSAAAIEECKLALALEPRNPQVLGYAGQIQAVVGHWDDAARLTTASIALDPLFAGWHDLFAIILDRTGRLTEAEAERRRTLDISPTYERAHFDLGLTLLAEGKLDAAFSEMQQETPDGGRDAGLAIIFNAMGRKADSDAALERFMKQRAGDRAYRIAQIYAYRGDADAAFVWLDRAFDQRDVDLLWFKRNLAFRDLESDRRYKTFLHRMKLPE
jgi:TolB-like protein